MAECHAPGVMSSAKGIKNKRFRGRVARLSSAKAPTAVRIRSEPLSQKSQLMLALFLIQFREISY